MEWQANLTRSLMRNSDTDRDWRWPSNAQRENWERVTFDSAGAEIAGVYGEAAGESSAAIVLAHPNRSDAKGYFLRSEVPGMLREEGYDVLAFDFNDFGESERGTVQYHRDIVNAVDAVGELSSATTTAVLGVSLGGASLIPALAALGDDSVDAAIFDSTYPTLKPFLWPDQPFAFAALRTGQLVGSPGTRELSPVRYADSAADPDELLFIYGEADSYITDRSRQRLLSEFPHDDDDISVWTAPETRHNSALTNHPEKYVAKVTEYVSDRRPAG